MAKKQPMTLMLSRPTMPSNLKLSPLAIADIRDILTYTQKRYGTEQRQTYSHFIFKAIETIADNPELGHVRPDIPPICRAFNVKKHVVVYEKKGETVFILRLLHGSMNFDEQI